MPKVKKAVLLSIPVLFTLGGAMHFIFELLNENPIVGAFVPVNESIWEHCKMSVFPLALWWLLYYPLRRRKHRLNPSTWFFGALCSVLCASLAIPMLYYFYTGSFGVHLMTVDILILLIALGAGQLLALHLLQHNRGIDYRLCIALILFILIIFAYFTFQPPRLPIFMDVSSGTYGI